MGVDNGFTIIIISFYAVVLIRINIKSRPENNTCHGFRELLSVFLCHTLYFIYIYT